MISTALPSQKSSYSRSFQTILNYSVSSQDMNVQLPEIKYQQTEKLRNLWARFTMHSLYPVIRATLSKYCLCGYFFVSLQRTLAYLRKAYFRNSSRHALPRTDLILAL